MSSEQTFSTSDLRATAQDYKRDATRKHKWALGTAASVGRAAEKPRPHRPSETEYNLKRREVQGAVASFAYGNKVARKNDMLEGNGAVTDDDSSSSSNTHDDTPSPPDTGIMYSFDASRGPSHGSQILNVALAKAVQKYEEKETDKLVKTEYDMIDSEGESVALSPVKKKGGKGKVAVPMMRVPDADEDYEFI